MSNGRQSVNPSREGTDTSGDSGLPRIEDLINPEALEARLAEARAKRAEAAKRAPEPGRKAVRIAFQGKPPRETTPVAARNPARSAPGGLGTQRREGSGEAASAVRLADRSTVKPKRPAQVPGGRMTTLNQGGGVARLHRERPAPEPTRTSRRLQKIAIAIAAGFVLGLGGIYAAAALQDWRIVIVRPTSGDTPPAETAPGEVAVASADLSNVERTAATAVDHSASAPEPNDVPEPQIRGGTVSGEAVNAEAESPAASDPRPFEPALLVDEPVLEPVGEELQTPRLTALSPALPARASASSVNLSFPGEDGDRLSIATAAPMATKAMASGPILTPGETGPAATGLTLDPGFSSFEEAFYGPLANAPEPDRVPDHEGPPEPSPVLAASLPRVILHYPPDATAKAEEAVAELRAAGLDVSEYKVDMTISTPNVRFFHDADRPAAGTVASLLSTALGIADVDTRSFVDFEPSPEEGLVEIWLAGSPPAPQPAARRPARAQVAENRTSAAIAASPGALTARERERLVRSIQQRLVDRLR